MLKGAIDLVHPHRIGGWIYSETGSLRGRTVLAFLDDQCVGSGSVEIFRKDLADAGLGDGYLGFAFPIGVPSPEDAQRAVIKLDGSDLILLQPKAKIATAKTKDSFLTINHSADSIEWMRSSGWLAPADFTFLKYINQIGAYDYSLRLPKSATQQTADLIDPIIAAQPMLDLLCLRKTVIVDFKVSLKEDEKLGVHVLNSATKPLPIVAITSQQAGTISVLEGSHFDAEAPASLVGAVDYPYGPDRLLFLNLTCTFAFNLVSSAASLRILAAE